MLRQYGDDAPAEGPNPLSSIRVRPVYPGCVLAVRRRPTHHANVVILGFRLTPTRSLAFRRAAARLGFLAPIAVAGLLRLVNRRAHGPTQITRTGILGGRSPGVGGRSGGF